MSVSPQQDEANEESSPAIWPGRVTLAATCCLMLFLYALYLSALSVLLPVVGRSFGLTSEAQGRLFPATFVGFFASVLLCGYLSDRFGRKVVLLGGIAGYAAGLALFGIAPSFPLALAASFLLGGGGGVMECVASALASDLYPEKRAFLLNTIQVAFGMGAALSPKCADLLLAQGVDWRWLYFGLAAVTVLLFIGTVLQPVPSSLAGDEALNFAALGRVLRQPVFLALCVAQALYVGAEVGFFSWMPTYFAERLPDGARWAGMVVTVFWIVMTTGRLLVGALIGRLPLLRLVTYLALSAAVFATLALSARTPQIVMVWAALTGFSYSSIYGLILAEAGERYPAITGTVFGGIMAVGGLGSAVIPWVVGALATTALDWRGALMLIPGIAFCIAVITALLGRK